MVRASPYFFAVGAVLIGALCFWWLAPRERAFGMFSDSATKPTIELFLAYAATVFGVVLGSLYRDLKRMRDERIQIISDISAFLSKSFRSIDMWLGLVGSPVVFAMLLKATDGISLAGLIIIALENGFCALLLLDGLLNEPQNRRNSPN